jgi:hypothetical protein
VVPPNPADYACLGDSQFGLLARITPISTTRRDQRHHQRAQRQQPRLAEHPGRSTTSAARWPVMSMLVGNDHDAPMKARCSSAKWRKGMPGSNRSSKRSDVGMPEALFRRIEGQGKRGRAPLKEHPQVQGLPNDTVFVRLRGFDDALDGIALKPGERFPLHLVFQLRRDYKPTNEPLLFDVVQQRTDGKGRDGVVGGARFQLDVSQRNLDPRAQRLAACDLRPAARGLEPRSITTTRSGEKRRHRWASRHGWKR